MESENIEVSTSDKVTRNIFIRIIAALFWFLVTIFIGHAIVGGVIGGMAGSEVSGGAAMSVGEAAGAGAAAGQQASAQFMQTHGGKVFLVELIFWLGMVITGKFPWVSKFKKASA